MTTPFYRGAGLIALSLVAQVAVILGWAPSVDPAFDVVIVPLAIIIGLAGLALVPGRPWLSVLFMVAVMLVTQFGRWSGGWSEYTLVAGRMPLADAKDYLSDALAFLHGHDLAPHTAKRPIFVLMLAGLLKITGANLPATMAIFSVLNGLAVAMVVAVVRRSHGSWAAGIVFVLLYFYYRRFIGVPLSEHVGFALGCLATAFLWRGAAGRALGPICAGAVLLGLALVARAGAMVVLALLPLWAGWALRGERRFAFGAATLCLLAAAAPFLLNHLLIGAFGQPGAAFNNFSYTFYGLLYGGTWTLVLAQHPELVPLPELERTQAIMALALDGLKAEPWRLATGSLRALANGLTPHKGLFSFIYTYPDAFNELVNDYLARGAVPALSRLPARLGEYHWFSLAWGWMVQLAAWIALVAGMLTAARAARRPQNALVLVGALGVLLSLPFAPPWDADFMRAYAATIPLQCVAVGIGGAVLSRRGRTIPPSPPPAPISTGEWAPLAAMGLILLSALTARGTLAVTDTPPLCAHGPAIAYRGIGGTWADMRPTADWPHALSPERFVAGLRTLDLTGSPLSNPLHQVRSANVGMVYMDATRSVTFVQTDDPRQLAGSGWGCAAASNGIERFGPAAAAR